MNDTSQAATDRQARDAALAAVAQWAVEPTSLVTYHSEGRLLVISPRARVQGVTANMPDTLQWALLVTDPDPAEDLRASLHPPGGIFQARGLTPALKGHLGAFALTLEGGGESVPLAPWGEEGAIDLVLDLGATPLLNFAVPPFGYYAPRDEAALAAALAELPEMVGEFDKPKYFSYDPDICAFGRSGLAGCRRCLDTCPTGALTALVERIAIDPYYCQGGGSCASACPTGAITYRYPRPADTLDRLRLLLRHYREAGGLDPRVLFCDGAGREALAEVELPGHVLPLELEEIGAAGPELWLNALAYGARRVLLLAPPDLPPQVFTALENQREVVAAALAGLGLPEGVVAWTDPAGFSHAAHEAAVTPEYWLASAHAGSDDKRRSLLTALDWLAAQADMTSGETPLPLHAPFGEVIVDRDACTLCMACVSVCPAKALFDGGDLPRLDFLEANCVQCGLCETACPENAITRRQRLWWDKAPRDRRRTLNEEPPFHCISCGVPFATRSVIERMTAKLEGHRMFQDPEAKRRLQMCGDCRVKDMFKADLNPLITR
ncbi:MAG: 4Fe-4S binding protein [Candidatus Competibacterales bacterium]